MNGTPVASFANSGTSAKTQQELLDLARHLDRFGRNAELFLTQQFEQLERALEEFEREKAAWRRQVRRETDLLNRQADSVRRMREQKESGKERLPTPAELKEQKRVQDAKAAAGKSGELPIRMLLQPGKASLMQVGLLMFEISKLNRDMGGRGLNFDVADVRMPKKRLLARNGGPEAGGEILELTGASRLPLRGRGTHVELDVDVTERIACWIAFKSQLVLSSLTSGELSTSFQKGNSVKRDAELHSVIGDAVRRADDAARQELQHGSCASGVLFANSPIDAGQQQLERLEGCAARLFQDCGLRLHIELKTA